MKSNTRRIVIIGANFAGLAAARRLSRDYDVTVVDAQERFDWTPNIHEILSSTKTPDAVTFDRRTAVERHGHRFVLDQVTGVDREARRILTSGGARLGYDACLIATGGAPDAYGIPGVQEHTHGFRRADEAAQIASRLAKLARRKRGASVAIVGAGVSGIEALGEILRRYRRNTSLAVHVVEASDRILSALPAALGNDVLERCASLNVHFHTNAAIERIGPRRVHLQAGEELAADLCIWTAGVTLPAIWRDAGLTSDDNAWLPVNRSLQCRADEAIFVAGDAAGLPSPIRKQAYYAMDMGEVAGDNLRRHLDGDPLRRFTALPMPMIISFGDLNTYFVAGETVAASPLLAAAKEGIYLQRMAQLDPADTLVGACSQVVSRGVNALRDLLIPQLRPDAALAALHTSRILRKD